MYTAKVKTCTVCRSTKSGEWRHPGPFLMLYKQYFMSSHATNQRMRLSHETLDANSLLCNSCFLAGYRNAGIFFPADKSTVEGYINYLELHSPTPSKDTLTFTEHMTLLYCLRRLKEGERVYLAVAMDVMRSTRQESGLKSLHEDPLRDHVVGMFKDLARCVVGVDHHCFDGDAVGDMDKRVKAHYLMPTQFSPLYVASLHRRHCRLEKHTESRSWTIGCVDRDAE